MISIIIPVYNVTQYLDQCLQSVMDQSYTDWECILVDDGSKDGSGEICDEWCQRDSRFRVIHQHNQGVSAARNNGIKASTGEYISFIDADDWVACDYLQDLVSIIGYDAELYVSGIQASRGGKIIETYIPSNTHDFSISPLEKMCFFELFEKYLLSGPWAKLFITQIIKKKHVLFDKSCVFGEDLLFNFEYLQYTNKIATVAKSNYYYRKENSGTLSKRFRENQFDNDYRLWKVRADFLRQKNLWTIEYRTLMYKILWGLVYDGIFTRALSVPITYSDIKYALSIPEIQHLHEYSYLFQASKWIKYLIMRRQAFLLFIYLRLLCR